MKKNFNWLIALTGICIAFTVLIVFLAPKLINIESYKAGIELKIEELTGRSFSLGENHQISIFPNTRVVFRKIRMGNPQGFGENSSLLDVKSIEIQLKLLPLLAKKIEIIKVKIDSPELKLTKLPDGKVNWVFGPEIGVSSNSNFQKRKVKFSYENTVCSFIPSSSDQLVVANGRIIFEDRLINLSQEVKNLSLSIQDLSNNSHKKMSIEAMYKDMPIHSRGTFKPLLKKGRIEVEEIDLFFDFFHELKVKIKTDVLPISNQKFNINIAIAPFAPKSFFDSIDLSSPILSHNSGSFNNIALNMNFHKDQKNIEIHNMRFHLDDSIFQIEAKVKDLSKPEILFKIDLDYIDIDKYLPTQPKNNEGQADPGSETFLKDLVNAISRLYESEKNDNYKLLRNVVFSGKISNSELIIQGKKVQNLELNASAKDGIFIIDPLRLSVLGGTISTIANINFQGDRPKSTIGLSGDSIQFAPLLQETINRGFLKGALELETNISFLGDTMNELKKELTGSGRLKVKKGAIVGIDLVEIAQNNMSSLWADRSEQPPQTIFDELQVSFYIINGTFQTIDTFLSSDVLHLNAAGSVHLTTQEVDFKVQPKLLGNTGYAPKGNNLMSSMEVPMFVKGTLSELEFYHDMGRAFSKNPPIHSSNSGIITARQLEEKNEEYQ